MRAFARTSLPEIMRRLLPDPVALREAVGPLLFASSCSLLRGRARSRAENARRAQFDDFLFRVSGCAQNLARMLAVLRRLAVEASALPPVAEPHRTRWHSDPRYDGLYGKGLREHVARGEQMRVARYITGPARPRI